MNRRRPAPATHRPRWNEPNTSTRSPGRACARIGERGGDIPRPRRVRGRRAGEVRKPAHPRPAHAGPRIEPRDPPAVHARDEARDDAGGVLVGERGEHREHAPGGGCAPSHAPSSPAACGLWATSTTMSTPSRSNACNRPGTRASTMPRAQASRGIARVGSAQGGDRGRGVAHLRRRRQPRHRQFQFEPGFAPAPVRGIGIGEQEIAVRADRARADRVGVAQHARRRSSSPSTSGFHARAMPAFSKPMACGRSPSQSTWSMSTVVTTATSVSTRLTASSLPPRPTSSTARSRSRALEQPQRRQRAVFEIGQRHFAFFPLSRWEKGAPDEANVIDDARFTLHPNPSRRERALRACSTASNADQRIVAGVAAIDAHAFVVKPAGAAR